MWWVGGSEPNALSCLTVIAIMQLNSKILFLHSWINLNSASKSQTVNIFDCICHLDCETLWHFGFCEILMNQSRLCLKRGIIKHYWIMIMTVGWVSLQDKIREKIQSIFLKEKVREYIPTGDLKIVIVIIPLILQELEL